MEGWYLYNAGSLGKKVLGKVTGDESESEETEWKFTEGMTAKVTRSLVADLQRKEVRGK